MIAGPVLFAMADMASYALTLVLRQAEDALTANLLINLFRLALDQRLLGEAVSLRAGRPLLTSMTFASGPKQPVEISRWRK